MADTIFNLIGEQAAEPALLRAAARIRAAGDRMIEAGERIRQAEVDPPPSDSGSPE